MGESRACRGKGILKAEFQMPVSPWVKLHREIFWQNTKGTEMKAQPRIYIANDIWPGGTAERAPKQGGVRGLGVQSPASRCWFVGWGCRGTGWVSPLCRYRGRADNCLLDPPASLAALIEQYRLEPGKRRKNNLGDARANPRVREDLLMRSWLGNGAVWVKRTLPGGGAPHPAARGMGAAGADDAPRPRTEAGECGGAGDRPGERAQPGEGFTQNSREREQRHPGGLGKVAFACGCKALGNNNQDLSLGDHHSNIKTQVGERCFPVEPGGASRASSLRSLSPDQARAEAEQSLAGRKAGFNGEGRSR